MTDTANPKLETVRKLLAKAEDPGVTPQEAEALTAKAAELMARYGIDQALLEAARPQENKPADKRILVPDPWARVNATLLSQIATAMRCYPIQLNSPTGITIHLFGYSSDIERAEVLYTSLLLQMAHGLARQRVPGSGASAKAWRRSWMLGFIVTVIERVKAAEHRAETEDREDTTRAGTALVLADRSVQVKAAAHEAYPHTRRVRVTYSGTGYARGAEAGSQANIGGTGVGGGRAGALTR